MLHVGTEIGPNTEDARPQLTILNSGQIFAVQFVSENTQVIA